MTNKSSYLYLFTLVFGLLASDELKAQVQVEESINDKLKTTQASAYRCLSSSKIDSVYYFADQLLELANHQSTTPFIKAKQFNYAAYLYDHLGNTIRSFEYADSASLLFVELDSITADLASSLWRKGTCLLKLGDYIRAKDNLKSALDIAEPIDFSVSNIQNDLANAYYLLGDLKSSKAQYESLLEKPDQLYPLLNLIIHANLTDIYLSENNIEKAKTSWQSVDPIITAGHLDDSPQLSELLKIKANLFRAQSDFLAAFETTEEAIDFHLKNNPKNQRDLIKLYCSKAEFALDLDDSKNANETISLARKIMDENEIDFELDPYNMVVNHLQARTGSYSKERSDSSIVYCKNAQAISDKIRLNMLHQKSKLGIAEYLTDNTSIALDAIYSEAESVTAIMDAFYFMDKSRNQILLDEMLERIWSQKNALGVIDEIKRLELEETKLEDQSENHQVTIELDRAKQTLREEFGQVYSALSSNLELDAIRESVYTKGISLLMFGESGLHTYALLIQKSGDSFVRLEIENEELDTLINMHTKSLENVNIGASRYAEVANELYESIFSELKITNKSLCIIPNESLNNLSFASLVIDDSFGVNFKSLNYLSDQYDLSYALSSYFLIADEHSKGEILGIVDSESEFGNLNSHLKMLQPHISELGGTLKDKVDPLGLAKEISNTSLLHISSHGFYDSDDAMESYILMPGEADFKYRIRDIYQSSFKSSPLVILNSCETGKGHTLKGEGSNNFTRALFYAGAGGVIENEWKINAFSTSEIFNHFYTNFKSGDNSVKALSSSFGAYRNQGDIDQSFAHPYYWAGFKYYGNPTKIESGMSPIWWTLIITCFLILGVLIRNFVRKAN